MNGLAISTGQYIIFIDSDDYVKKNYIRTYVEAIEKEQCEFVVGGYIRDIDGTHQEHFVTDSEWSIITFPVAWGKLFSRKFLLDNDIDFADLRMGEDVFFSLNVFYYAKSYKIINYCGYYYYLNSQSLTKKMTYDKNFEEGMANIFDLFMSKCDISLISNEKRNVIEYTYLANMINALITYGHGGKIKRMKKKYDFYIDDVKKRFPTYKRNPHIGILKPQGQSLKIRLGVGVVMSLHRVHLDRVLFYIISLF